MGSVVRSNVSFPNGFSILRFIAVVIASFPGIIASTEIELEDDGCSGGTCPSPTPYGGSKPGKNGGPVGQEGCGLWMGPSPIKKAAEHDFGLGIFTGKVRRYLVICLFVL